MLFYVLSCLPAPTISIKQQDLEGRKPRKSREIKIKRMYIINICGMLNR